MYVACTRLATSLSSGMHAQKVSIHQYTSTYVQPSLSIGRYSKINFFLNKKMMVTIITMDKEYTEGVQPTIEPLVAAWCSDRAIEEGATHTPVSIN